MNTSPYAGLSSRSTPQTQPLLGRKMVQNEGGGYSFELGAWKAFERFLILGSEGGSFYTNEVKLTRENAERTIACILEDGARAVAQIVAVSEAGRAPKNDPAIFALALAASLGSPETRACALAALPRVARIPTHLFHFLEFTKGHRGWGRAFKRAIAAWYEAREVDNLAYTMAKYQQRDGWSHRDVLRKVHPKVSDPSRNVLYRWAVDGIDAATIQAMDNHIEVPGILCAMETAKDAPLDELLGLIKEHNLPREMLPTEALKRPEVWEALLERMPPEAMIRNLGNLAKHGLIGPFSDGAKLVRERLADKDLLKKARIHPLQVLVALKIYDSGHGMRGDGTWKVNPAISDSLDEAFYSCFDYLTQGEERLVIGIDCSGSMTGARLGCAPNFSAAEASAAMAMACLRTSKEYHTVSFDTRVQRLPALSSRMRLTEVLKAATDITGGGTDCAVPIAWALDEGVKVDAFLTMTDSVSWSGKAHVVQTLKRYRERLNPEAKHVVVGMVAYGHSLNDPKDLNALDVAGFDAGSPAAIQEFVQSGQ